MRNTTLLKVMIVFFIVFTSITAHAYKMVDYWAFNEGNIWVYDRDLQLIGNETHVFSQYTGRLFIQLPGFYRNHPFIYSGSEGVMAVGMYFPDIQKYIDLSATPIKMSNAEMNMGDSVTNNIPAGVIDEDEISITFTLEAVETVTVPAGTYNDALKVKVYIVDGVGTYTEHIWLAKNVGAVKMYRVSETNNTSGCFFTCASFDKCSKNLVERTIQLKSFIQGKSAVKNKLIIIPLGD